MPTNDDNLEIKPQPHGHSGPRDAENPGYETTDINVSGVAVFLAGLFGSVLIFFVFCFGMGKVINNALEKQDGPVNKWNEVSSFAGAAGAGGKRQDLANNPELEQKALAQLTTAFPNPRLDVDDGEQGTADLHAREDLLLDHYSSADRGTVRIPIDQAMELIAKKGLPVAAPSAGEALMAGDAKPVIQVPLTTGFARTGYELDVIEARAQKMSYGKAEESERAELKTTK
ncbi:hypothetical protein [Granulicella arctica]|uniref:Uncharacterized protein n=1 Tax=Granulicella arctica TaxID=940613 RepID=A0A7Y9TJQ7_9BACT|nr:hypothetical protein [Granulicella arctica]NYF78522.1 hypothetical protein [Granulicella arctica]